MGRHNSDSWRKKEREARKAERALAKRQKRDSRGPGEMLPEGSGWLGTGDLKWEPIRDGERRGRRHAELPAHRR